MKTLTIEAAIEIQKEHLHIWKGKLNADCYCALSAYCLEADHKLNSNSRGYYVPRGDDLYRFIANWSPPQTSRLPLALGSRLPDATVEEIQLFHTLCHTGDSPSEAANTVVGERDMRRYTTHTPAPFHT